MSDRDRIQELLERYVEVDVVSGEKLSLKELCREDPALLETLGRHVESYEKLSATLDMPVAVAESSSEDLPTFEGFRTVERLGKGGGGEVFKLEDLELGRVVARGLHDVEQVHRRVERLGQRRRIGESEGRRVAEVGRRQDGLEV